MAKGHKINKTIQSINQKIKDGKVVVATAEEIIDIVKDKGAVKAAEQADDLVTVMPLMRFRVLSRDNFRCVACGRGAKDGVILHVDHNRNRGQSMTIGTFNRDYSEWAV